MLHQWLHAMDRNGSTVRIALLEYQKAFDLVDHHLLTPKLFSLGVKPTGINWIIDFLRDRQQRVRLNNNCYSSWLNVPAGVPQGMHLGPWLFSVMINNLKLPGEHIICISAHAQFSSLSHLPCGLKLSARASLILIHIQLLYKQ